MGVEDLWNLISPCGKTIPLSNLAARRLAIDVSVWLVQFIKAMRDESGNPIPGAS